MRWVRLRKKEVYVSGAAGPYVVGGAFMTQHAHARGRASSSHFAAHRWVDYVRGLGNAAEREVMAAHLASGCARCRDTADLLSLIAAVARLDATSGGNVTPSAKH